MSTDASERTQPTRPRRARAGGETLSVVVDGITLSIQREARTDLYSTFRVGGPADYLVRVGSAAEVLAALRWADSEGLPVTIFGGGSNLLVSDAGIRGLVIGCPPHRARRGSRPRHPRGGRHARHRARPAAAPSTWFGRLACERGWAGLSWLVGLPGNVGGAIVNNAGAHGGDMQQFLQSLRVVDLASGLQERDHDWLEAAYRYSRLKVAPRPRQEVVIDAVFRLPKGDAARWWPKRTSTAPIATVRSRPVPALAPSSRIRRVTTPGR
jgi:UDP-N-acetylmuramate dehydrogenase